MKRFIYSALYIASVIAICVGLAHVKGYTIQEAAIADGVVIIIAIAIYKIMFDEFEE